ncbi:MAG: hypothetical protein IPJ81_12625 [Chitinophagaceae bacterium]|nr:hypothetical protein [Chitinophagaceae bacterium]
MKNILLFISLTFIFSGNIFAQFPTAAEIKNKKIKKVTIYHEGKTPSENSYRALYFDENGNDTAFYNKGERWQYKVIQYDEQQRPLKIEEVFIHDEGRPNEITTFVYNPDGSYVSEMIDSESGAKDINEYDKDGKQLKSNFYGRLIDFLYNEKGQLIKQVGKAKDDLRGYMWEYKYDSRGKLILRTFTDEYRNSKMIFEYNKEGLLSKEIETENVKGFPTRTTVEKYVFSY